jgi:hypothetical protein
MCDLYMEHSLTVMRVIESDSGHPPKAARPDWAAMRQSLIYDERGVGRTPDGAWAFFPRAAEPAFEKALPAGHKEERAGWMFLGVCGGGGG